MWCDATGKYSRESSVRERREEDSTVWLNDSFLQLYTISDNVRVSAEQVDFPSLMQSVSSEAPVKQLSKKQ